MKGTAERPFPGCLSGKKALFLTAAVIFAVVFALNKRALLSSFADQYYGSADRDAGLYVWLIRENISKFREIEATGISRLFEFLFVDEKIP
ncbi:MAG: hypothetical protein D6808_05515, partial [Candidatus Dadabacteria bacterium]